MPKATSLKESSARAIRRKVAQLKEEMRAKSPDKKIDLRVVGIRLVEWGKSDPIVSEEHWSEWQARHVEAEDHESTLTSKTYLADEAMPRFAFWYQESRDKWLKIAEGLGARIKVCDAGPDHWKLWEDIRRKNFERIKHGFAADERLAAEMKRQFELRPHLQTTDQLMREVYDWRPAAAPVEPEPEPA